ncbi:MAG: hypothetical protein ACREQE_03240 [Candidatus Binataceae bacterium]
MDRIVTMLNIVKPRKRACEVRSRMTRVAAVATLGALVGLFAASPAFSFNLSRMLGESNQKQYDTFKLIRIAGLKTLMANHATPVHIFDANGPDVRDKYGVIPGSRLLSSDDNYSLSELPSDKNAQIVFYCTNMH